jgi:hypothetical protein
VADAIEDGRDGGLGGRLPDQVRVASDGRHGPVPAAGGIVPVQAGLRVDGAGGDQVNGPLDASVSGPEVGRATSSAGARGR